MTQHSELRDGIGSALFQGQAREMSMLSNVIRTLVNGVVDFIRDLKAKKARPSNRAKMIVPNKVIRESGENRDVSAI